MDAATTQVFERTALMAPHPVAVAAGRIMCASTSADRLDAVLRAGEALTRYSAALALASLSARTDPDLRIPTSLDKFDGNLSWDSYLKVNELVSALPARSHPLAETLRSAFQANDNGMQSADDALKKMVYVRNERGHDLQPISPATAEVIFRTWAPDQLLVAAINSMQPILDLPLFVLDDQQFDHGQLQARRLLFMGESENPKPDAIVLTQSLYEKRVLYLGLPQGALNLWPWLCWDLAVQRVTYAVYVIHAIAGNLVKFKSMYGDSLERNSELRNAVVELRAGRLRPVEQSSLADGRSFLAEWAENRQQKEQMLTLRGGPVPWDRFDAPTVAWYASRLPGATPATEPRHAIQATLLNNRDFLSADEIDQLMLLFGPEDAIRQALGHEMLDCRARSASSLRWDDRVPVQTNVIESLRVAVQFFGRHVGIDGASLDGLHATSGAADYIAMREALVNLFIHQDYSDARAAAQVTIVAERAIFFNTGKSLVTKEGLVDGDRSQSRNPLIARALRLIGFAELAGSGLRLLQDVWRQAKRRPPRFDSNDGANSFTLTLDWRSLPVVLDSFWKDRLGVVVTPQQGHVLDLLVAPGGFTDAEVASGTGILLEDVQADLQYLQVQSLIERTGQKYVLREHLRVLLQPKVQGE